MATAGAPSCTAKTVSRQKPKPPPFQNTRTKKYCPRLRVNSILCIKFVKLCNSGIFGNHQNDSVIMRDLKVLVTVLVLLFMFFQGTQCGSRYNTIEQKDPNAGDAYVYGEIDGPAKQAANQYEPNPEQDKKAGEIREKFFGENGGIESGN